MSSLEYYSPFSPKYSHNQYIKFENLQIVSPSEDVKIFNVLGKVPMVKVDHLSRCASKIICRRIQSFFRRRKMEIENEEIVIF